VEVHEEEDTSKEKEQKNGWQIQDQD